MILPVGVNMLGRGGGCQGSSEGVCRGDADPRVPGEELGGPEATLLSSKHPPLVCSFQKRVLFLTNDYFFTDISDTPFR